MTFLFVSVLSNYVLWFLSLISDLLVVVILDRRQIIDLLIVYS